MMKKKIVWITPDYFYDVDWPIIEQLSEKYEIRWYVLWGKGSLIKIPSNSNIYKFVVLPYRQRDPRIIKLYYSIFKEVKSFEPAVLYNGFEGSPYFYPLLFSMFDKNRIIHEGHEIDPFVFIEHDRLNWSEKIVVRYMQYYLRRVGLTQVFSKYVEQKFYKLYPDSKCIYVPMVPKFFGEPMHTINRGNKTVFLFFGKVYRTLKRFDLLLDAFLSLEKEYSERAELWVYGKCDGVEKEKYQQMINGHDNIKTMFDFVPDEMIPELFSSASYLVQPYQKITQSGPTMIAFNYNLPVIGSNIDGFKERIEDGKNGYLFEVDNVNDLKRVLKICINQNETEYNTIKSNLKAFVEQEYSPDIVIQKYCNMFDSFIQDSKN